MQSRIIRFFVVNLFRFATAVAVQWTQRPREPFADPLFSLRHRAPLIFKTVKTIFKPCLYSSADVSIHRVPYLLTRATLYARVQESETEVCVVISETARSGTHQDYPDSFYHVAICRFSSSRRILIRRAMSDRSLVI
jgi:hypothetical protein